MTYWWNIHGKLKKSFVKPNRPVKAQDTFATFHYCVASRKEIGSVRIPQVFCLGNAIWLTMEYYDGKLMQLTKLSSKQRKRLIEGELHDAIVSSQLAGKTFLRKSRGILCGPDEYYNRIVFPLGPEFYWGSFVPEMNLCIANDMNFSKIMKHDFNLCDLMKEVRNIQTIKKKLKSFKKVEPIKNKLKLVR